MLEPRLSLHRARVKPQQPRWGKEQARSLLSRESGFHLHGHSPRDSPAAAVPLLSPLQTEPTARGSQEETPRKQPCQSKESPGTGPRSGGGGGNRPVPVLGALPLCFPARLLKTAESRATEGERKGAGIPPLSPRVGQSLPEGEGSAPAKARAAGAQALPGFHREDSYEMRTKISISEREWRG